MKPGPFEEMGSLDRLVHDPSRLAILTALSACKQMDFQALQSLTGQTSGNLSMHLTKLQRGELVTITKSFRGRYPLTTLGLTKTGRDTIRRYWKRLEQLRRATKAWRPSEQLG